jgi:hypothetical protein
MIYGIDKDFQQLMELVYGPLGKKEREESAKIAKELVDNAVQKVKKMTENEEEIEKVKAEIKVLEKKLSFLVELEKTKTPCEEAFKRVYGFYPETYEDSWSAFQDGYIAAQKDYKVGEFQEPKEEDKTLYQMLADEGWHPSCDVLCDLVKRWMFQYDSYYASCKEYLEGYEECQTVLEERLK